MESVVKVGDNGTAGGSVMESAVKTAQDRPLAITYQTCC